MLKLDDKAKLILRSKGELDLEELSLIYQQARETTRYILKKSSKDEKSLSNLSRLEQNIGEQSLDPNSIILPQNFQDIN